MSVSTTGRENGHGGRPRGYAPWRPQAKSAVILDAVTQVLEEYEQHLPLTIRQIFYRLVGTIGYEKTEAGYHRLCELMNRARRAEEIPFDHIRDDGVTTYQHDWHRSPADFWDDS